MVYLGRCVLDGGIIPSVRFVYKPVPMEMTVAIYRRLYPRLYRTPAFRRLDSLDRLITIEVMTGQANRIGIFGYSPELGAANVGTDLETFRERLGERSGNVCQTFGWCWDSGAEVMYLPTWWKWNLPANPNVFQAALSDLDEVPKSRLIMDFVANTKYLPETFAKRLGERWGERLALCFAQDQEQDQEQDLKEPPYTPQPPAKVRAKPKDAGYSAGFLAFWAAYPRRVGKGNAWKAWNRLKPDLTAVSAALDWQTKSPEWTKDGGEFIPHPATYLNARRWEDEPSTNGDDGYRKRLLALAERQKDGTDDFQLT